MQTSVKLLCGDSADFEDFGGGWHLILPLKKDDYLKLLEVNQPRCFVCNFEVMTPSTRNCCLSFLARFLINLLVTSSPEY